MSKHIKNLLERLNLWLKMWPNSRPHFGLDDWIALGLLIIGVWGYFDGPIPYKPEWDKIYMDIRSELIGIGASVLIIANAGEYISTRQEKKRLILQMGSPDNSFAIEAVRLLRARGWLLDGSLSRAFLNLADLTDANLNDANLNNADLGRTILINAKLELADLTNVNLIGAELIDTRLIGAKLINSQLGFSRLCGAKLGFANLTGVKLMEARYDTKTEWPDGFDPIKAGAHPIGCEGE